MERLIGDVVLKTEKIGPITTIFFRSGRLLILTDEGLIIRRSGILPLVIG
jgi:hypothetical protein